ncbi:hypothetical protein ACFL2D_00880, partial [Patescibacteria group bacterium]
LRGRSGRQGQPGFSRFYVSAEDELMTSFASEGYQREFQSELGKSTKGVSSKRLDKLVGSAQEDVESRDRSVRRLYFELNKIVELQRQSLYKKRDEIFEHPHVSTEIDTMVSGEVDYVVQLHTHKKNRDKWPLDKIVADLSVLLPQQTGKDEFEKIRTKKDLAAKMKKMSVMYYRKLSDGVDSYKEANITRQVLLEAIDDKWSNHLEMAQLLQDHLPTSSFGKQDPFRAYRKRLQAHYDMSLVDIRSQALRNLFYLLRTGEYTDVIEANKKQEVV